MHNLERVIAFSTFLAIVLITIIVLFGDTFGQRCSAHWPNESPEWYKCVEDLASGKKIVFDHSK